MGTISLWPDIPWLWPFAPIDGLAVARAARIARAGTKAVRAVRFFRILRLVRVIRILKFIKLAKKMANTSLPSSQPGEDDAHSEERGALARRHAETVEMRVVIGSLIMLLGKACPFQHTQCQTRSMYVKLSATWSTPKSISHSPWGFATSRHSTPMLKKPTAQPRYISLICIISETSTISDMGAVGAKPSAMARQSRVPRDWRRECHRYH